MLKFKLYTFAILLSIITSKSYAQFFEIYQAVDVEKYQGKNFILEGKIFYMDDITNSSWAVLGARSINADGKQLKQTFYNDNASDYFKKNEWSAYELSGKIEKGAKYLATSIAISGNDSYYLDDFKLFIKDGKNKIEIPLKNGDFETNTILNWQSMGLDKNTSLALSKEKAYSGAQSLFIDNSAVQSAPTLGNNPTVGKYAELNGIKLYYEIYGEGEPLLLLHGNNSSIASFENQVEILSKKYEFLQQLQLKNVNILGWSDGGNIALIVAMQYPDKVKKMAVMGTVLFNNDSSVTPETNKLIRQQVKEMRDKGVAESNMDYRLKMLLLTEPNINPDSLKKIQAPTLVIAGQYDVVKEKHSKLIAENIQNSKLLIFKGADHEAPKKIPQLFNKAVLDFFEK